MRSIRSSRFRPWFATAASASILVVAACSGGGSGGSDGSDDEAGPPQKGGEVVMAIGSTPQSFDPAQCYIWTTCNPIYGSLLRFDTDTQKIEPSMAKSFESDDGKTWTLGLREDVTFTDGTPFDADAVAYNWKRAADPELASEAAGVLAGMTFEVVDPLTLEITLEQVNYQLPWNLVFELGTIGSPTAMEKAGPDFGKDPVGAGAFTLDQVLPNSEITYQANPDYWDEGLPYLDGIRMVVIPADEQRQTLLESGEANMNWNQRPHAAQQMEEKGFTVHRMDLIGGSGFAYNWKDNDLKDPDLRQALLQTFDPAQMLAAVYDGVPPSPNTFFPASSEYRDEALGTYPEKDLAAAQKSFDAYLAKTGQSGLTLSVTTYAAVPLAEQTAQILQSQLQEIDGLKVTIDAVDPAALQTKTRSGDYQITFYGGAGQQYDSLYDIFHSDGALNMMGYSNPKVDEALELTRSSDDERAVAEAYTLINAEISKDAPVRPYMWDVGHLITSKEVKGVTQASSGYPVFESAWIKR